MRDLFSALAPVAQPVVKPSRKKTLGAVQAFPKRQSGISDGKPLVKLVGQPQQLFGASEDLGSAESLGFEFGKHDLLVCKIAIDDEIVEGSREVRSFHFILFFCHSLDQNFHETLDHSDRTHCSRFLTTLLGKRPQLFLNSNLFAQWRILK
jgi:hypothetical protein